MFKRIFAIALNTFREAIRDRVPLGLFGAGLVASLASLVIASMSLGRDVSEVIAILTSSLISIFVLLGSIVLGASSLYKDIERKTILPILARPIQRYEVIFGKHLGLLAALSSFAALQGSLALTLTALSKSDSSSHYAVASWGFVALIAVFMMIQRKASATSLTLLAWVLLILIASLVGSLGDWRKLILITVFLSVFEAAIVLAMALVFGSFSSPFLTAVFTACFVIIGRNADSLAALPERIFGPTLVALAKFLARIIPNLHVYVPPRVVALGYTRGSGWNYLWPAIAYSVLYTLLLLVISVSLFRKRDFS